MPPACLIENLPLLPYPLGHHSPLPVSIHLAPPHRHTAAPPPTKPPHRRPSPPSPARIYSSSRIPWPPPPSPKPNGTPPPPTQITPPPLVPDAGGQIHSRTPSAPTPEARTTPTLEARSVAHAAPTTSMAHREPVHHRACAYRCGSTPRRLPRRLPADTW